MGVGGVGGVWGSKFEGVCRLCACVDVWWARVPCTMCRWGLMLLLLLMMTLMMMTLMMMMMMMMMMMVMMMVVVVVMGGLT